MINFALPCKVKLIKSLSGLGQLVGDYPQAPYVFLTQKKNGLNISHSMEDKS